jgi:plastocyanin
MKGTGVGQSIRRPRAKGPVEIERRRTEDEPMTMRFAYVALLVTAVGLAAGIAAAFGPRLAHAAAADAAVAAQIDTFQFKPRAVEAKAGAKIVWTNNDDVTHTVTSGTPEQHSDLFNGTLNGKGTTFEYAPARVGSIVYFCARHPHMRGEITVRE